MLCIQPTEIRRSNGRWRINCTLKTALQRLVGKIGSDKAKRQYLRATRQTTDLLELHRRSIAIDLWTIPLIVSR